MSRGWWFARRVIFAVFAAYLVLSTVFVFVALTPDPRVGELTYAATSEANDKRIPVEQTDAWERLQDYKAERNLDDPFFERYERILVSYTMFDWGESYGADGQTTFGGSYGSGYAATIPVIGLVGNALGHTLRYVLPAVLFAVVCGLGAGLYSATHQSNLLDRLGTSIAYLGFSFPNFWLGTIALALVGTGSWLGVQNESEFLRTTVLPAAVLGTTLFAGQLRYTRAQSLEYIDTEFIKLVRAKGATNGRVARHLLRNAAVPLLSLFFADMLGLLVLNVFVIEYVFGISGIGSLALVAIQGRDLPVILGTTMIIVLFGVAGNLLQDVAYQVFDPRIGEQTTRE